MSWNPEWTFENGESALALSRPRRREGPQARSRDRAAQNRLHRGRPLWGKPACVPQWCGIFRRNLMNEDIREQIALFRFKCISPVLAEPDRERNAYFRRLAQQELDVPQVGRRHYALSTFKGWLRDYRADGFEGLKPLTRADDGVSRRFDAKQRELIKHRWSLSDHLTARLLYEQLTKEGLLGDPPAAYNTLLRFLHHEKLLPRPPRTDTRKRFETAAFGELWLCDFMHGPQVQVDRTHKKAILCAIIDDHTRLIVGYAFQTQETISALTSVMKDALSAYGLPKRFYTDNGSAFSCDLLAKACAQGGISLIHSKPYDSPSRGKIERFFRTVRDRFLPGLVGTPTLDDINLAFHAWLNEGYHHQVHSGTGERPIERYKASAGRSRLRRVSEHELDEFFLVRHERIVNNDATISFQGTIYEVPAAYIRQRIEIRHPVDDPQDLALYDNGDRVARLKPVNPRENARTFCVEKAETALSFSQRKVES